MAGKTADAPARRGALAAFFSLQRESAAMRFVARGVLATWLLPTAFALVATLATPVAQAQTVDTSPPVIAAPAQSVVVLDFATNSGIDPLIGRKAADGLAVELQRSGSYDVVPRQRVEQTVAQQPGLQPPFNNTSQIQLATAVNASSVFSGTVTNVDVVAGRMARVTIQVNQLDIVTGDFINGTVITESSEQKLTTVPNEVLVDEAINKAAFAAVRSMRQITLPTGTVLNVAVDEVVLSIGVNEGASIGDRYTVLRDKPDFARNIVERSKIGEVTITRVNPTQSSARITAGGFEGVRTGDKVRQIFVASNYPVTSRNGNSVTPVSAAPRGNGKGGGLKRYESGIYGLVGLAALVALVGFGGGGNNNAPRAVDIIETNPTGTYPQPRITFEAGFSGINLSQQLDRESVVAYLVYRGTSPNFTPDAGNLQAVIDGRNDNSGSRINFSDAGVLGNSRRRKVTINATVNANNVDIIFDNADVAGADILNSTANNINIEFTQRPLTIGQTYYYRVGRVTAGRTRTTVTDATNTAATQVVLLPVRSPVSGAIGGYTPLFQPRVVPDQNFNTDNFSVLVDADVAAFNVVNGYALPPNFYVGSGVTDFRFEVSTSQSFPRSATFVSPDLPAPPFTGSGFGAANQQVRLTLGNGGDIRIPSSSSNPYIPGVTPLYLRVLSRNTNDRNPVFRISPTFRIDNAAGLNRTNSSNRFIAAPTGGAGEGFNLVRGGLGNARTSVGSTRPRVIKPQ